MSFNMCDFKDCQYLSLAGADAPFVVQDRNNTLMPTPLFEGFCKQIEQHRPKVAVVDTLADINPTDENQRSAAGQFIQLLRKPAIEFGCAVIALAHFPLTGLNIGSGTSGSTAWINSVRSRMYLTKLKDEEADPNLRVLELMESNYSQAGTTVNVRWKDGLCVRESGGTQLDRMAANKKAERVFIEFLDAYTEQGRKVNSSSGPKYAPSIFASDPKAEGIIKSNFLQS